MVSLVHTLVKNVTVLNELEVSEKHGPNSGPLPVWDWKLFSLVHTLIKNVTVLNELEVSENYGPNSGPSLSGTGYTL